MASAELERDGKSMRGPFERATLTQHCYLEIRRRILSGELAPGERLNEKQLATALRVSPTPVREALNKLRSDGLISYSAWQGATVVEMNADDLRHLYNIRSALESLAIREAFPNLQPLDVDQLDHLVSMAEAAISQGESGAENIHQLNHLFHQYIVDRTNNPWLGQMMAGIQDLLSLARRVLPPVESGREAYQEHLEIMAAIRAGDAAAAEKIMVSHIERIKSELLARAAPR